MAVMYDLFLEAEVHDARQSLPGHVRQRIRRLIDDLAVDPRPTDSRPLNVTDLEVPPGIEIRRVRMEQWRLVYAVSDEEQWVWVLSIRRRPPYNYVDLPDLIRKIGEDEGASQ